jgi:hypothetical protein
MANHPTASTEPSASKRSTKDQREIAYKLKSWPKFFSAIMSGAKTHELRRTDDRTFHVGDFLLLQEFDSALNKYTGRELTVKVTYITSADLPCALSKDALHRDFCILSIKRI